jgi:hypothetical protein
MGGNYMDPISNQVFSHDAVKFVYQDPDVRFINYNIQVRKPFKVEAPENSKKTKKDVGKGKHRDEKKGP